jgi:hypothetical protein
MDKAITSQSLLITKENLIPIFCAFSRAINSCPDLLGGRQHAKEASSFINGKGNAIINEVLASIGDRKSALHTLSFILNELNLSEINEFLKKIPNEIFSLPVMKENIILSLIRSFKFKHERINYANLIKFVTHATAKGTIFSPSDTRSIIIQMAKNSAHVYKEHDYKQEMKIVCLIKDNTNGQTQEYIPLKHPAKTVMLIRNNISKIHKLRNIYNHTRVLLECSEYDISSLINHCDSDKFKGNTSVLNFILITLSLSALNALKLKGINDTGKVALLNAVNI